VEKLMKLSISLLEIFWESMLLLSLLLLLLSLLLLLLN